MDWFKFLSFSIAIVGSVLLAFWPTPINRAKPAWWRWLTIVALFLLVLLSFMTPTSGSFGGLAMVEVARGDGAVVPVRGIVEEVETRKDPQYLSVALKDGNGKAGVVDISGLSTSDQEEFKPGTDLIVALQRNPAGDYTAQYLVSVSPVLSVPLIPALEERARNLYYHVPVAWISQLAWCIAFWFAILYLRKRDIKYDVIASSAAAAGAVFCILATTTGAVWAKFNWGSFWNWDPRQVSIFVVLIIYGAYFALRSAVPNTEQRARISSIYLILLLLPVIFFIFVYPRITPGLHPGALGDESIGPVIDPNKIWLDQVKQAYFALGFFALTMLYFWVLNISVRTRLLEIGREKRHHATNPNQVEVETTGITAIEG